MTSGRSSRRFGGGSRTRAERASRREDKHAYAIRPWTTGGTRPPVVARRCGPLLTPEPLWGCVFSSGFNFRTLRGPGRPPSRPATAATPGPRSTGRTSKPRSKGPHRPILSSVPRRTRRRVRIRAAVGPRQAQDARALAASRGGGRCGSPGCGRRRAGAGAGGQRLGPAARNRPARIAQRASAGRGRARGCQTRPVLRRDPGSAGGLYRGDRRRRHARPAPDRRRVAGARRHPLLRGLHQPGRGQPAGPAPEHRPVVQRQHPAHQRRLDRRPAGDARATSPRTTRSPSSTASAATAGGPVRLGRHRRRPELPAQGRALRRRPSSSTPAPSPTSPWSTAARTPPPAAPPRSDAIALLAAGNTDVASNTPQVWGSPRVEDDLKLFGNFGDSAANGVQLYSHTNYASKKVTGASSSGTRTRGAASTASTATARCSSPPPSSPPPSSPRAPEPRAAPW